MPVSIVHIALTVASFYYGPRSRLLRRDDVFPAHMIDIYEKHHQGCPLTRALTI